MNIRNLLLGSCFTALLIPQATLAQVDISDARTTTVSTSTEGENDTPSDVNILTGGSVTVTEGTAVELDSDNALTNAGAINITDANDVTGVLISGGVTGSFSNTGSINLTETNDPEELQENGDISIGTGRVGILISGASPFTGNVENATGSQLTMEGRESAGIRLDSGASMIGDILHNGQMTLIGGETNGIEILGDVIGNLAVGGLVASTGENNTAVNVAGDIDGGIEVSGSLGATGYASTIRRPIPTRPLAGARDVATAEGSIRQARAALAISGNVTEGVHFSGTGASANVFGSAPAILIDGDGTPIAIGQVSQIVDTEDADFNEDLLFAFVNEGSLTVDALFDDVDATTFRVEDATLTGGINNTNTMRSNVYRSGVDLTTAVATNDSHAQVIVIGNQAIAERINNSGTISARGLEATDTVYADADNIQEANTILATAINVEASGDLASITNTGSITALIFGRDGSSIAIRDNSGTLTELNNSGTISAFATNSDAAGDQLTNFTTVALDATANTAGFTLTQTAQINPDGNDATDDDVIPVISGDILLGSGADNVDIQSGSIVGDLSFGDGADSLSLRGSSTFTGQVTDSDGLLDIIVADNSTLSIDGGSDINVTSASFDATSTFTPFVNPDTNDVSVLTASGDVTFADGATIAPRISNVFDNLDSSFTIVSAGNLITNGDLGSLRSDATPYLFDTSFARSATDPNTLIMTLDVRDAGQLGLDAPQTALFSSAFEALQTSDALGSAFTQITDQTAFNAAYNQLLPEFASAARQFILSNVNGATGAVGSHLDNARLSQDKPGGVWLEEFAYYADKSLTGLSDQYRGYGFGITGGFDTAFGPFHTAGINIGFASTEIEDVLGLDEPTDILTLQGGLYAAFERGALGIDIYGGGGYSDIESSRRVNIGTFSQSTQADWSGNHFNGSVSAGYDLKFGDKFFARPSATISYLSLSESAYREVGDEAISLDIDSRSSDIGTGTLSLRAGARFEKDRSWWSPSIRVGVSNDFISDGVTTTGQFQLGTDRFTLNSEPIEPTAVILGFSLAAGSKFSSFALDYDGDFRDGFNRHTMRLIVRLIF